MKDSPKPTSGIRHQLSRMPAVCWLQHRRFRPGHGVEPGFLMNIVLALRYYSFFQRIVFILSLTEINTMFTKGQPISPCLQRCESKVHRQL